MIDQFQLDPNGPLFERAKSNTILHAHIHTSFASRLDPDPPHETGPPGLLRMHGWTLLFAFRPPNYLKPGGKRAAQPQVCIDGQLLAAASKEISLQRLRTAPKGPKWPVSEPAPWYRTQ